MNKPPIIVEVQDFAVILKSIRASQDERTLIPSDVTKVKTLIEVRLPKEGGIYSYFEGDEFPHKGFPDVDTCNRLDDVKKLMMAIILILHSFASSYLGFAVLVFSYIFLKKPLQKSTEKLIGYFHGTLEPHLLNPIRYCVAVREIYRAFDEKHLRIRNLLCMILEFDDAYRYRFQYTLGEINSENLRKNPYKELSRLIQIVVDREKEPRLRDTFKKLKKFLFLASFFKVRNEIMKILLRLDPDKLKLDEGDRYYAQLHHNLLAERT